MRQQAKFSSNSESSQEIVKQRAGSKFSATYWEPRVVRPMWTKDGKMFEVQEWHVRLGHAGQQKRVPLGTNDRQEAGRRAVLVYKTLQANGWDAAFALYRKQVKEQDTGISLGDYLTKIKDWVPMERRTLENYAYAIRRIVFDVAHLKLDHGSRYSPMREWRKEPDKLPLSVLTDVVIENWRSQFLKARKGDPLKEQKAIRSANSYVRNARALFSRRILDAMKTHGVILPDPLPFSGVRMLPKTGSTRYRSNVNASVLLAEARKELIEDLDSYRCILLALGAGLRRSEIDVLQWQNVMPDQNIIRVITTAQRRTKSNESEGDVQVDPALISELQRIRGAGATLFVVCPDREHKPGDAGQYYRCSDVFRRLSTWLRAHGVLSDRPLHVLRKEFGSIVAATGDILQAQRQLRHAQISTTEQFYADARKRATVQVGDWLKEGAQ